jgi:hypothetical protein
VECCGRSHSLCMFVRRGNIQRLWLRPEHSRRSRQSVTRRRRMINGRCGLAPEKRDDSSRQHGHAASCSGRALPCHTLSQLRVTTSARRAVPPAVRGQPARRRGRDALRCRSAGAASPHRVQRRRTCSAGCRACAPPATCSYAGTTRRCSSPERPCRGVTACVQAAARLCRGCAAPVSHSRRHRVGSSTHLCFRPYALRRGPTHLCRGCAAPVSSLRRHSVAASTHLCFRPYALRRSPTHLCRGRDTAVSRARRHCVAGSTHGVFSPTHCVFGPTHMRFRPTQVHFAKTHLRFRPTHLGQASAVACSRSRRRRGVPELQC